MRADAATKYARALAAVAASRGRADEAAASLDTAASFFASDDGRAAADVLQSSRVPRTEREALLDEITSSLDLAPEVAAIVSDFSRTRSLASLGGVAARARAFAALGAERAEAELRTARPLAEGTLERIRSAAERALGQAVRLTVVEDASLLGGVVLRAGNRIWDGSLAGRIARAAEALVRP